MFLTKRAKERNSAISDLNKIFNAPEHSLLIHYSCESFYDRTNGTSPRITSIAVRNLKDAQTSSFSIHKIAEQKGLSKSRIERDYDNLEKEMLRDFFNYVKVHAKCLWIHWNMRDINYGFQAIEHRYRVLGGKGNREIFAIFDGFNDL